VLRPTFGLPRPPHRDRERRESAGLLLPGGARGNHPFPPTEQVRRLCKADHQGGRPANASAVPAMTPVSRTGVCANTPIGLNAAPSQSRKSANSTRRGCRPPHAEREPADPGVGRGRARFARQSAATKPPKKRSWPRPDVSARPPSSPRGGGRRSRRACGIESQQLAMRGTAYPRNAKNSQPRAIGGPSARCEESHAGRHRPTRQEPWPGRMRSARTSCRASRLSRIPWHLSRMSTASTTCNGIRRSFPLSS